MPDELLSPREDEHPAVAVAARSRLRHPIFAAVDCGALDDVPAAIACFSGIELVHANVDWCNLIGFDHQQSLGYGWLDAFGPHDRDTALSSFEPEDPTTDTEVDLRLNTHDGSECWVRVRSRLLREDVLPVQRLMTMTMIDAHRRRSMAAQRTGADLVESAAALRDLASPMR